MSRLTKRLLLSLAAGIAAGGAAFRAAAQDMPAHERQLYEAARREGEITWYSGQYNAETSEAVGRAFNERYPGMRCNVVRSTYEPLRADVPPPAGGRPLADVTLLAPSIDEQEKGVLEVREAWRDTFGV